MHASDYGYTLPEILIAKTPAQPRDAARLFIYDTIRDEVVFDTFLHLEKHLPPSSLLVMNDTKVVPARAMLKKETGGKIEVLFLMNEWAGTGPIPAIVDRKLVAGTTVFFDARHALTVVRQQENIFYLEPRFGRNAIFALLDRRGTMPIPKYIKGSPLSERALRTRYQTVFGKRPASIAAPTASLHFTDRVFKKIAAKNIGRSFITLHVGLGTFAPVSADNLQTGTLHTEFLTIPQKTAATIRNHKRDGRPVVAVGTTVVRTLESQARKILDPKLAADIAGSTDIFIKPPHHFAVPDAIITNFHLPSTSLMMLVDAFLQDKKARRSIGELYAIAVREKFRFYSFGDAMLIK